MSLIEESDSAKQYAAIWRARAEVLEQDRLRQLSAMSEQEAARIFAALTGSSVIPAPRSESGLVEQQRILARFYRVTA